MFRSFSWIESILYTLLTVAVLAVIVIVILMIFSPQTLTGDAILPKSEHLDVIDVRFTTISGKQTIYFTRKETGIEEKLSSFAVLFKNKGCFINNMTSPATFTISNDCYLEKSQ